MLGKEYKQSRLPELSIHQFRTVTHVTISRCPCHCVMSQRWSPTNGRPGTVHHLN